MMVCKYFFLLFFSCFIVLTKAQNLVPNPSFEQFLTCPNTLGVIKYGQVSDWYANPKDCTPDYFNACAKKEFGVPDNICGNITAHSGKGYAGIIVRIGESNFSIFHPYNLKDLLYREHLAVRLQKKLEPNFKYVFSMQIALADYSNYAAGNIGVLLAHFPLEVEEDTEYAPQILFSQPVTAYKQWVELTDTLIAKGGEQYLIIGNFDKYKKRVLKKLGENKKHRDKFNYNRAYYYIDDVSLFEIGEQILPPKNPLELDTPLGKLKKGQKFILNNIFFDFDKATLLPNSFSELDKLASILQTNQQLKIYILGHTDSVGTEQKNQILSEQRAISVSKYLEQKGIDSRRIRSKGFGETRPIDTNETPEGRKNNRRVEAVLKDEF